jgi:cell wall-associated NlpC family hydrolase
MRELETPWGKQHIFRGSFIPFGDVKSFNIGNDHFHFVDKNVASNFKNPVDLATEYINTAYLWGGKSPFGIDCSGLTQTVYRFFDINLPRDASQQVEYGMTVDLDDSEEGDLAFFTNKDGKVIHVGILDGKGSIVHASGCVRKDILTAEGIINQETGQKTHDLYLIKRL